MSVIALQYTPASRLFCIFLDPPEIIMSSSVTKHRQNDAKINLFAQIVPTFSDPSGIVLAISEAIAARLEIWEISKNGTKRIKQVFIVCLHLTNWPLICDVGTRQ